MGYIYRITNTIDGKRYIGQTKCDDVSKRWKQHKQVDRRWIGPYLYSAYGKYGIENFKFEIVCICFDKDCDKYEKEYILKFNTLAPNGYNINLGSSISKHSEESKQKIRQKMIEFHKNNKKIVKRVISEKQKEKLRTSHMKYWKSMKEEKYKEICAKRREDYKKIENNNKSGLSIGWKARQKKVGKFDLSGNLVEEYPSVMIAAEKVGIHHATIRKVCRGQKHYHTAAGFKWKFL